MYTKVYTKSTMCTMIVCGHFMKLIILTIFDKRKYRMVKNLSFIKVNTYRKKQSCVMSIYKIIVYISNQLR